MLESADELGGQLLWTHNAIKNYLGVEVENGRELQQIFLKQIESRDFELRANCKVFEIDVEKKEVRSENGEIISADAIIIATGIRRRKLNLDNEENFQNKGILSSGKREAEKVKGKKVCVVGGGDAALENALILAEFADEVTLIHRRSGFRARSEFVERVKQSEKINILTETAVTRINGQSRLESVELQNLKTNITSLHPTDFLILRLGVEPNTELLQGKIELDENSYCLIDSNCETSAKNVYSIGDVANPLAPTISGAVGMGASVVKVIFDKI